MESSRSVFWIVVAGVIGLAFIILIGGIAMGIAMSGGSHCCGRGGADQTPVVVSGSDAVVEMQDLDFSPRDLTVDVGATVTWTNEDNAPHDAVSDNDGAWKTEILSEDESASVSFKEAGVFKYHCSIHPFMKGTVTVR